MNIKDSQTRVKVGFLMCLQDLENKAHCRFSRTSFCTPRVLTLSFTAHVHDTDSGLMEQRVRSVEPTPIFEAIRLGQSISKLLEAEALEEENQAFIWAFVFWVSKGKDFFVICVSRPQPREKSVPPMQCGLQAYICPAVKWLHSQKGHL